MASTILLTTTRAPGGAEGQARWLRDSLRQDGFDCYWICLFPAADVNSRWQAAFASIRTVLLERRRSDVGTVVTFNFHPNALGPALTALRATRLVTSIRTEAVGYGRRALAILPALRASSAVVFNSRRVASEFERRGLIRDKSGIVVPNHIQLRPPIGVPRTEDDYFRLVTVARLHPAKNVEGLLAAVAVAGRHTRRTLLLDVIGTGELQQRLQSAARRMGLARRVRFLGWLDDPWAGVKHYDAFVHTALWEGQPNALLEAMSTGLPVIATSVGGVPEIGIERYGYGLEVPKGDIEALATAIEHIESLPSIRLKTMGHLGREYISASHSPRRVLSQWREVLRLD